MWIRPQAFILPPATPRKKHSTNWSCKKACAASVWMRRWLTKFTSQRWCLHKCSSRVNRNKLGMLLCKSRLPFPKAVLLLWMFVHHSSRTWCRFAQLWSSFVGKPDIPGDQNVCLRREKVAVFVVSVCSFYGHHLLSSQVSLGSSGWARTRCPTASASLGLPLQPPARPWSLTKRVC